MKITKSQIMQIIKEELQSVTGEPRPLKEQATSSDQWTDAILDWIYSQLPEGGLLEETPAIVSALHEVIQTLESPEANPESGGMYGEEPY
tara:strand:+ start:270 stop:539 length:270 start_codon:yes stop_codon:yes gene_type:complete